MKRYLVGLLSIMCLPLFMIIKVNEDSDENIKRNTSQKMKNSARKTIENNDFLYKERADYTKKMCAKHREELFKKYKIFYPNLNYNKLIGRAKVLYENNTPSLMCLVPKAASTSLKTVFVNHW